GGPPGDLATAAREDGLVDRDALEQVPQVQVVRREETEAVLAGDRSLRRSRVTPAAGERAQPGTAATRTGRDRGELRRGEAAVLDRWVRARRGGAQLCPFVLLRLVDGDVEAALHQFVGGGEAGDAGAEYHDLPARPARARSPNRPRGAHR